MYTDAFRIKYLAGYHWTPFFVLLQKEWGSPFHVKPIQFFSKLRTERNFFNLIFKKIYILNGEKLESLLLRSETRQVYPVSPLLYKLVLDVLTNAIDKKRYTGWERRNKTVFVHMQHDCLCRKSQRITQKMGIRALINLQWGLICRMVIFYSNSRKEPSNSVNTGNLMLLNRYICGQNIFLIIFKLEPDCVHIWKYGSIQIQSSVFIFEHILPLSCTRLSFLNVLQQTCIKITMYIGRKIPLLQMTMVDPHPCFFLLLKK